MTDIRLSDKARKSSAKPAERLKTTSVKGKTIDDGKAFSGEKVLSGEKAFSGHDTTIKPYRSASEHLHDYLFLLTLVLQQEVMLMRQRRGDNRQESFLGLFISDHDMDAILCELSQTNKQAQSSLSEEDTPLSFAEAFPIHTQIAKQKNRIAKRLSITRHLLPWQKLQKVFSLKQAEVDLLLLCLAAELDTRFSRAFAFLHDDVACKLLSIELADTLLAKMIGESAQASSVLHHSGPLRIYNMIWMHTGQHNLYRQSTLKLRPSLIDFLSANAQMDELCAAHYQYPSLLDLRLTPDPFVKHIKAAQQNWQSTPQAIVLNTQGSTQNTHQAEIWAQHFAQLSGLELDFVDCSTLHALSAAQADDLIAALAFDAHINSRLLLLKHIERASMALISAVRKRLSALFILHLSSASDAPLDDADSLHASPNINALATLCHDLGNDLGDYIGDAQLASFTLAPFTIEQSAFCFQQIMSDLITLDIAQCQTLVENSYLSLRQYRAIADDIKRECALAKSTKKCFGAEEFESVLLLKTRHVLSEQMQGLAQKVQTQFTLNDIVLTPTAQEALNNITRYQAHHGLVMDTWGFEPLFSLSQNHAALFIGPSGTGKTMAASVIANTLELDLFRIELATVVSKYIGETEKNLDKIFNAAKRAKAVLFIDEADALFGKRTAVKDAHDRYANLEVSYLLQKLEEHPCLVILASNLGKNIDDAFLRRFSHVVEFTLPQAPERLRLWKKLEASKAPVSDTIDYAFLADKFELSGGSIRNCILQSAYMAASDKVPEIQMYHLVNALAKELIKERKPISKSNFGQYFELLKKPKAEPTHEITTRSGTTTSTHKHAEH